MAAIAYFVLLVDYPAATAPAAKIALIAEHHTSLYLMHLVSFEPVALGLRWSPRAVRGPRHPDLVSGWQSLGLGRESTPSTRWIGDWSKKRPLDDSRTTIRSPPCRDPSH